jgi:hypothetical protein
LGNAARRGIILFEIYDLKFEIFFSYQAAKNKNCPLHEHKRSGLILTIY